MKIISGTIARNAQDLITAMVQSLSWVDEIVIMNDHSTDNTVNVLESLSASTPLELPNIHIVHPFSHRTMMDLNPDGTRDISHEMEVRNLFIDLLFNKFAPDAVLLVDSDELISSKLRQIIEKAHRDNFASVAFNCIHLFDENHYLHVYENEWNGVNMVDPHVRVLFKKIKYQRGEWEDVPDCFIKPTSKTCCVNGPYHYHLKYLNRLGLPNYSFRFLPRYLTKDNSKEYIRKLVYPIPKDLISIINNI